MKNVRHIFFDIFVIGFIMLLSGCMVPIKYQTAVPQEIPDGFDGKIHRDIIEINLPELTLLAQVQAFDWDGQYLLPPLGVWVNIDPKNGPLMLKTVNITLKSDSEEPLVPISYLGPNIKWFSPRALAAGCGPRFYRTGIGITRLGVSQESVIAADNNVDIFRPSEDPILIDYESCFMFWFDTDSLPDHTFILSINGITKDGQNINIPKLRFEKGTLRDLKGFP